SVFFGAVVVKHHRVGVAPGTAAGNPCSMMGRNHAFHYGKHLANERASIGHDRNVNVVLLRFTSVYIDHDLLCVRREHMLSMTSLRDRKTRSELQYQVSVLNRKIGWPTTENSSTADIARMVCFQDIAGRP